MEAKAAQRLCELYDLGRVVSWRPMPGTRNHNLAIETDRGLWFARRRFRGYAAPARVTFDHDVLSFLAANEVPVVAPLQTTSHASFVGMNGAIWEVFPFVRGETLREGCKEDLAALGQAVGRFHRIGLAFRGRDIVKLGPRGETDPELLLEQADIIEAESPESATLLSRYLRWIRDGAAALPDSIYGKLPATLVHGDLQPANVLVREGRIEALIDVDWCMRQPRIYDLAFAFLFCCAVHDSPIQGNNVWSLTQRPRMRQELVRAFLGAYETEAGPLDENEKTALRAQIVLSWCHSRLAGALKVGPRERTAFILRGPERTEELLSVL